MIGVTVGESLVDKEQTIIRVCILCVRARHGINHNGSAVIGK